VRSIKLFCCTKLKFRHNEHFWTVQLVGGISITINISSDVQNIHHSPAHKLLIQTANRVARYAYAQSAICHSMRALGHPLFKQLRGKVVQSKRFSSFARELSANSQWSIPYNKVQNFNKCFSFCSKRNLRGFLMTLLEITKNRRIIITNTIENWYSVLANIDNKQVSFKNAAAASNTSGFWRVYL